MNSYQTSGGRQGRVTGAPYGDPVPSGATYVMADEAHIRGASGLLPADVSYGITTRGATVRTSPEQRTTMPAARVAASPSAGSQHQQHDRRALTGADAGYVMPYKQRRKRGGKRGRKTVKR